MALGFVVVWEMKFRVLGGNLNVVLALALALSWLWDLLLRGNWNLGL